MQETNINREIDLLQIGSESKLLELLDRANLSDRELDELPFGVNTTFSRFFTAGLVEKSDGVFFGSCECGGCFCDVVYELELNSWPSEPVIREISEMLIKLDRNGATVNNFKGVLNSIYYKLDVKKLIVDEFKREELEDKMIYELRSNIREAINSTIYDFRDKYSTVAEKDLERIIKDIRREFN